jgi:hypothetical protein
MPKTATPANSAPTTMPVRVVEPVAASTNHGRATAAISLPSVEARSATSSARNVRRPVSRLVVMPTPVMGVPPSRSDRPPQAQAGIGYRQ